MSDTKKTKVRVSSGKAKASISQKKPSFETTKGLNAKAVKSQPKPAKISDDQFTKMVQERAYYIWQEWGQPNGRDWDIWHQAQKDIEATVK
ncbi:MAG: DUF2934 domain-containing protein [Candidatus Omnitrophota bacterium]